MTDGPIRSSVGTVASSQEEFDVRHHNIHTYLLHILIVPGNCSRSSPFPRASADANKDEESVAFTKRQTCKIPFCCSMT